MEFKVGDKALVVDVTSNPHMLIITRGMRKMLGNIVTVSRVCDFTIVADGWVWNECNLAPLSTKAL